MQSSDFEKVTFESHGETLVGNLYLPETEKNAAVVLLGPMTFQKEQAPTEYARRLAKMGFAALVFDPRYRGESGGAPRYWENPRAKVEDDGRVFRYEIRNPADAPSGKRHHRQHGERTGHVGFPNIAHYNASKHGIIGMTKAAALANAKHKIRINSISPLAVDTPQLRESFAYQKVNAQEAAKTFVTPRIMSVDEIARAVMFLASDYASSVTGMDLDITGGELAK